ncbi:MAG: HEAT repeat domain-containing protein [Candidatus Electryoneaceae bacterium]|nr:HEAT repeat domain-containing protein [Candidatus Electryoneaceae bacterium]
MIIDVGGDDVYRGRTAGAMGELNHPYSLVIDLEGDDYYDAQNSDVCHGSGFLGIGVLIDRNGNDSYRSGNYAQGSGFFGIGVLDDYNGDDDRRGGYFLQGAGHCGVGMLLDDGGEGDDRYMAFTWAQGFASTFGYGLLYESGGDDNYRTGGAYYHAPLLPHDYRSFSGGFGMGWRPRAGGGIGVLYDDGDGNDFYGAEVMSFGSSYWYSLGILVDGGGNDHYTLAHYGLGVGIHLSAGALYDVSGDDQYRSRHGVVGGTPHDLSVGMMVDGDGDDYYMVSDGWGGSLTNSFGLFIDRLGNDTYGTRASGYSFGGARWARGFAGTAIFLDLEGNDVYTADETAHDSSIWIQSGWGIGIDLPRDVVTAEQKEVTLDIVLTAEDSAKSIEELFEQASQWEVGSARESVRRGRKALLTKGVDAIIWVIDNKLDTRSGLEYRAIEPLIKEYPDTAMALLIDHLDSVDEEQPLKNIISWLAMIEWESGEPGNSDGLDHPDEPGHPAVDPLLKILRARTELAGKVRRSVISALGAIGDQRAAEPISWYVTDDMERNRLASLNALRELKDVATISVVVGALDDVMFTVRSAAIGAVVAFGTDAVPVLVDYINDEDSRYRELGLKSLKNIVMKFDDQYNMDEGRIRYEAVSLFERGLVDPSPYVRAESVDALYRTGGDAVRLIVDGRMESEYNPVVMAAYRRVKEAVGE